MQIYLLDLRTLTPSHRSRKTARHLLLGEALGISDATGIALNPHGKPYIPGSEVHFNLSHGRDYTALAIHTEPPGVDIEAIEDGNANAAKLMFTQEEQEWIAQEDSVTRFYVLWAKKESIMKAKGLGFSLAPQSFSALDHSYMPTECFIFDKHMVACAAQNSFEIERIIVYEHHGTDLRERKEIPRACRFPGG